jgi:outer membrane lipoprotein
MRIPCLLALSLVFLIAGCAHNISPPSLALVDRSITFSKLWENPDAYQGKYVLLGGTIAYADHTREGYELEVVQYGLDGRETPDPISLSGGRFIAVTPESLYTPACKRGTPVSMVGEVTGKKTRELKGVEYTYPVIAIKELKVFKTPNEQFFQNWNPYGEK